MGWVDGGAGVLTRAGSHWRMCGGDPRLHTQPRSLWRRSMAKRRGPWKGQTGEGSAASIEKSFGVTAVLHRRHTHSGCHSLVVRLRVGAQSMCRAGSSRQDVSLSGW